MVQPRGEPRYIVPAISVCIEVEFMAEDRPFMGRLWDVSQSGACLLFPRRHAVTPGQSGPLILKPPGIGEPIRTRAEILWVDKLRIASYAGARFLEQIDFESTFLGRLMRGDPRSNTAPSRHDLLRDGDPLLDLGK
jgi:hypothetical protein